MKREQYATSTTGEQVQVKKYDMEIVHEKSLI